jgi:hypothetical protein
VKRNLILAIEAKLLSSDPESIAASLAKAAQDTADHQQRIAAHLDKLPDGYQIKAGRRPLHLVQY